MGSTTWAKWAPEEAPTQEECEGLIGRRVRVLTPAHPEDWMTVVVSGVHNIGGRIEVLTGNRIDVGNSIWLWPARPHAPFVVAEVEVTERWVKPVWYQNK